jgi:ATP-binding cassette subfamily B protein
VRYPIRVKRFNELRAGLRRTKETLSYFTPFLKPRRRGLLLALLILLLETVTSLAQPWPLALTIDYVLTDNKRPPAFVPDVLADEALLLAGIALLIVLIFTVTRTVASFRRYLLQRLGQETVFDMRDALYAKVHAWASTTTARSARATP